MENWTAYTGITGENGQDSFGTSVSINATGNVLAVGADGHEGGSSAGKVYIYRKSGSGVWVPIGEGITGDNSGDFVGHSVSLNDAGDVVAFGAHRHPSGTGPGKVYVYGLSGSFESGTWAPIGEGITGENPGDRAGWSVSLNGAGNVVAFGAHEHNDQAGKVYIYGLSGDAASGSWVQIGEGITGKNEIDQAGYSVSLNGAGDVVAFGAYAYPSEDYNGKVYVYRLSGDAASGTWLPIGEGITGENPGDRAGSSVSLNGAGNVLAFGAYGYPSGAYNGKVYVYGLSGDSVSGTWVQIGEGITGEKLGAQAGWSVSLNDAGNVLAFSANFYDGGVGEFEIGKVYLYGLTGEAGSKAWVPIIPGITGENTEDRAGSSVSLNAAGDTLAFGADSYISSTNIGKVYTLAAPQPPLPPPDPSKPVALPVSAPSPGSLNPVFYYALGLLAATALALLLFGECSRRSKNCSRSRR